MQKALVLSGMAMQHRDGVWVVGRPSGGANTDDPRPQSYVSGLNFSPRATTMEIPH